MSSPAHPARLGLFVVGGLFLALATVIYVSSIRLFEREEVFLIYFDESVNGLSVGSPVKFKGVTIGNVSDIRLSYNQDPTIEAAFIPVFLRISASRVGNGVTSANQLDLSDWDAFISQVHRGLRGRLQLESIITGQLFIELDYYAQPNSEYRVIQDRIEYREIPSAPSVMAEIGSSATDILAKLGALDVKSISDEIVVLLRNANRALEGLDLAALNNTLIGVGQRLDSTLEELQLKDTMERLNRVLASIEGLTTNLDNALPPLVTDFRNVAVQLSTTLDRAGGILENLDSLSAPDAPLQQDLAGTLRELRAAARSARELLDFLERNPQALLSGRGGE